MLERILWLVAVLAVGGAAFFGGQQVGRQAGTQARAQAQQQFFAQRGGAPGTQGAAASQAGPAPAGMAGGQPVMGTVVRVDGQQLVVKDADGAEVTVTLAEGGVVRRQVTGALGDLQTGEQVVLFGARDGATMSADSVQVGGGFGRGGAGPAAP